MKSDREDPLSLVRTMYVGWKTWGAKRNAVFSPRTRWVPESARWLIANGKVKQAHKHLLRCARMNGRKDFTVSPEVRNWRSGHILPPTFSLSLCFTSTLYLKWCSVCSEICGALWSTGCLRPFCFRKHLHSLLRRHSAHVRPETNFSRWGVFPFITVMARCLTALDTEHWTEYVVKEV